MCVCETGILKGKESFVYVSFYACQCYLNNFYATLNQNAVRFDVPLLIQNATDFESVIEYRVPPIPRCVSRRLGKTRMIYCC